MQHLGLLLLMIVLFVFADLVRDPKNSALLGTGYHGPYQKLVPFGAAFIVWLFIDTIYIIITVFFYNAD